MKFSLVVMLIALALVTVTVSVSEELSPGIVGASVEEVVTVSVGTEAVTMFLVYDSDEVCQSYYVIQPYAVTPNPLLISPQWDNKNMLTDNTDTKSGVASGMVTKKIQEVRTMTRTGTMGKVQYLV